MRTTGLRSSLLAQTQAYSRAHTQKYRSWLSQRERSLKRGCCSVASAATDEKRENDVWRKSSIVFGFAWAWLALAGRKAIPWLFTGFCDFEPPEHVPRTSAEAHTCTQCSRGPPACPVTETKRKGPRAEEQKMPMSKKRSYYTYKIAT